MKNRTVRNTVGIGALLVAALVAPNPMLAQTVTIYGAPGNFDALNDTGKDAHGFQIELQGIPETTQVGLWQWSRFPGRTIPIPGGGVLLRWESGYTNGAWDVSTVTPAVFAPTFGHSCVQGAIAGCEHFGYYPAYGGQPSGTIMTWLVEDPQNPGTLIGAPGSISIPMPKVTIAANVVQFEINAPKPRQFLFGDAQWVKVLKNDVQHAVVVDELLEDNPVVPNDGNANQVETGWKLLQFNPHSPNSGVLRNQAVIAGKAVVRKYEFYKFSGQYDPIDHGAICGGDGLCNAPLDGELGDFIGNQMAAANVGVTGVTVAKAGSGSGTVTGTSINCGGSCSAPLALGTSVSLTAKPDSKSTFTGWTGNCVGAAATCSFIITGENNVTATFTVPVVAGGGGGGGGAASTFKISISKNGKGTVTQNPAAASYASGTVVTLTAIPDAGQPWTGWGGACSGLATTCTLTMTANVNVTANFR